MCGIAAIYQIQKEQSQARENLFESLNTMIDKIAHRGPDGKGLFVDEDFVGLGMCRLAIVDIETGNQPIWNEDHSVAIVCNGEIYNHRELRKNLESEGHVFTSSSDVEVIVHLYETYGEECLNHLEGIFAFTLWDKAERKLLVARDRLGVKPLYYTTTHGQIRFASEIRALIDQKHERGDINQKAFYAYNIFRYVPFPYTLVPGVHKIAPGQCLIVRDGKIHKKIYWQLPVTEATRNKQLQKKNTRLLKEHIFRAAKNQATHDVKSGILLSGGLDSTILLSVCTHLMGFAPDTYTVSFEKPKGRASQSEYSEIEKASNVAACFGSKHIYEVYSALEVLENLPSIIASLDEPIADPTSIPLWFATKLAHDSGVKVLFSGEGLDEIFNGYSVYNQSHWIRNLQYFPRFVRSFLIKMLEKTNMPGAGILNRSIEPIWNWYQGVGGVFTIPELKKMMKAEYLSPQNKRFVHSHIKEQVYPVQNQSALCQMTHFDVKSWLPENTLVKSDKVSMSHSIELRVPFLDYQLVEFAFHCSDREKLRGKIGKRLVREVAQDLIPMSVLKRKKAGFPVPITAWIFGEWSEYVHETLFNPDSAVREMYKPDKIEELFKMQDKSRAGRMLWMLLTFELWIQNVYQKENVQFNHFQPILSKIL